MKLLLCYGFIAWLFRKDMAWRRSESLALLVPGAWIAIQGSRPVSYWFGTGVGGEALVNTLVYGVLIVSAVVVLQRGRFDWGRLVLDNKALFLIYFYLASTALWSDIPGGSLKRLFKDFGSVLVALVFLVQKDPAEAVRTVFVRVSYLLSPLSVVFIKYYPHIGRSQSRAGENMFTGVTTQKNSLGMTVFVLALIVLWDLLVVYRQKDQPGKKMQIWIRVGMLVMGAWLLYTCDSQTSVLCLILGSSIMWASQRLVRMNFGKQILIASLGAALCVVGLDKSLGTSAKLLAMMGRDSTLTGRTDIWQIVRDQKTDQLIGNGYFAFWESAKGVEVENLFMKINTAHNGYLEMDLDGSLIGRPLLIFLLLVAGGKVINEMFAGGSLGLIGLAFWLLAIIYNFSESSFFRLDLLWFTFLLVIIKYPQRFVPRPTNGRFARGDIQAYPGMTPEESSGVPHGYAGF